MKLQYLLVLISFLFATSLLAQRKQIPPVPNPPRLVNDYAGLIDDSEEAELERKLVAYNDTTSTQIAVVIENTLEGDDIFDYSLRLAREWGIGGSEEKDNGVLLYIAIQDRQLYIQTGYGAEGFLPDVLARRIIDNIIAPAFRQGDFYGGVNEATDAIMKLGSGEYTAEDVGNQGEGSPIPGVVILVLIIILVVSLMRGGGGNDGGYHRGGRYGRGGWMFLPGVGGGFGGGGGGGGFGGGGGGFGGFGGGGFGGGGAGGSW